MTAPRPSGKRLRDWWDQEVVGSIDRPAIMAAIERDSGWSLHYALMVVLSAGIAVLGLLQSSPAVVIGAMLISPLMGPIIGLGFALAVFDWRDVRRALAALIAGSLLAIAFTALVVTVSPLQAVTSELLARTRPSLFDLLVAIFSALAGSYATIRGKGATIVGVAIATALMPPLATVGFGLATKSAAIAGGAFALFLTNFLAIALTSAIMARLYGFGSALSPDQTRRQAIGITLVFIAMAIPLGVSLRRIAWESLAARQLRTAVQASFPGRASLTQVDIDFAANPPSARVVVLTERFVPEAPAAANAAASRILGPGATLTLQQLITRNTAPEIEQQRTALAQAQDAAKAPAEPPGLAVALAALANRSPDEVTIDPARRRATVTARPPATPARLMAGETELAARFPDWQITVMPPAGTPLTLSFAAGDSETSPEALTPILWALKRWDTPAATATGRAASRDDGRGNRTTLARARAEAIASALTEAGIPTTAAADPPGPRQRAAEVENGVAAFRSVTVQPSGL